MKFGGDSAAARQKSLEARQRYRGLTFTDRGEILLDVTRVKTGRITVSQKNCRLNLLPETLMAIHQARREGQIPMPAKDPWRGLIFGRQNQSDQVECVLSGQEELRVCVPDSGGSVLISGAQLDDIVRCIVEPWLKLCAAEPSSDSTFTRSHRGNELMSKTAVPELS